MTCPACQEELLRQIEAARPASRREVERLQAINNDLLDALERIGVVFDFTEPLEPGALGIKDTGYVNAAFALADEAIRKALLPA